jgi:hypothetical protein
MGIVYALLDLSSPGRYETPYFTLLYKPYYIGKGYSETRAKSHFHESITRSKSKGKRSYKQNKIIDLHNRGIDYSYIVCECEDEDDAFIKEMELIELFGRFSNGGILTNVNPGGLVGTRKGYIHCHDKNGMIVYVKSDDKRIELGELSRTLFYEHSVMCVDTEGKIYRVDKHKYNPNIHTTMHNRRKRSKSTRKAISEAKLKYKFTEEHLKNITEANRLTSKNVHTGAKRKDSTKTAISKSRFGSKSKVANTWRLTDPGGSVFVYKGGIALAEDLFDINANRLLRYEGDKVPYPDYTGHKSQRIFNTIGWMLEKNPDDAEITFEFIFKKKRLGS